MPENRERLIAAAVRDFGDDLEQKMVARQWLAGLIGTDDETPLLETATRWEKADREPLRLWKHALLLIWLAVSLALAFPFYLWLRDTGDTLGALGFAPLGIRGRDPKPSHRPDLNPQARLLLGDPTKSQLAQAEALWQSDLNNPAYFIEYAVAHHEALKALPPDFFGISNRIDPHNAWFDYFAATTLAHKACEQVEQSEVEKAADLPLTWKILKEKEFHEALRMIHGAAGKTRYETYRNSLFQQRLPLLEQGNPIDRLTSLGFEISRLNAGLPLNNLPGLLATRAWELGETGDVAGFRHLLGDSRQVIDLRMASRDYDDLGELITLNMIRLCAKSLHAAALELGLFEEAGALAEAHARIRAYIRERKEKRPDPVRILLEEKGSLLVSAILPVPVSRPPPLSDGDLKPGRLVDHDRASRSYCIALWASLGLCSLAVFCFRFRARSLVKVVARRFEKLLLPRDWIWIMGAGVLLPVAAFSMALVFTPMGGRDRSIRGDGSYLEMDLPMANFVFLGSVLIVLPILLARWRLSLRTAAFNFPATRLRLGFGMLFSLVLFAASLHSDWVDSIEKVINGWLANFAEQWIAIWWENWQPWNAGDWVRGLLLGLPGLWILALIAVALFGSSERLLPRVIISRILAVAYGAGMTAMAFAALGFHISQRYWFERDDLMKMTASEPAVTPYIYRSAKQLRAEMAEMLDGGGRMKR